MHKQTKQHTRKPWDWLAGCFVHLHLVTAIKMLLPNQGKVNMVESIWVWVWVWVGYYIATQQMNSIHWKWWMEQLIVPSSREKKDLTSLLPFLFRCIILLVLVEARRIFGSAQEQTSECFIMEHCSGTRVIQSLSSLATVIFCMWETFTFYQI